MHEKEQKQERLRGIFFTYESKRLAELAVKLESDKERLGLSPRVSNLYKELASNLSDTVKNILLDYTEVTKSIAAAENRYYYEQGFIDGAGFAMTTTDDWLSILPSPLALKGDSE